MIVEEYLNVVIKKDAVHLKDNIRDIFGLILSYIFVRKKIRYEKELTALTL